MGRGNVCTWGEYEGQYYIDEDDYVTMYRMKDDEPESILRRELKYEEISGGEWQYDEVGSQIEFDWIIESFKAKFTERFNSFSPTDEWITRDRTAILENKLFYIALEDNEWSTAVELIQKEYWWGDSMAGLQKRHYQNYLDGIRDCLLEIVPEVAARNGPWMCHIITRDDVAV